MTQYPLLVDAGGSHVVAILTVPEGPVRGVVASFAATGRHNVVGSTLCAQLSQRVVEHGLASVRLDYAGTGDSFGLVHSWTPSDVREAVRQARAVLGASLDALGVTLFATVGTCYGTRVALNLVPDPRCVGAVCLAPTVLDYGGLSRMSRRVGERKVLAVLRSAPLARRMVRSLRKKTVARKPAPDVLAALDHLDRARIAFLYGKDPWEDHYSPQVREVLDSVLASLTEEQRERFELRMLPWGPLTTFDILPPADKEDVLDTVLPLVCRAFDEASRAPLAATGARSAGGA